MGDSVGLETFEVTVSLSAILVVYVQLPLDLHLLPLLLDPSLDHRTSIAHSKDVVGLFTGVVHFVRVHRFMGGVDRGL